MPRLTPEREVQIKAMDFKENRDAWPFHLEQLLEEIQALREENETLKELAEHGKTWLITHGQTTFTPNKIGESLGLSGNIIVTPKTADDVSERWVCASCGAECGHFTNCSMTTAPKVRVLATVPKE